MTTWVFEGEEQSSWKPLTPEEVARARAIMAEKSRPENVVTLPLSAVPLSYQHWIPKGESYVSRT
jgi:hypothetical protein